MIRKVLVTSGAMTDLELSDQLPSIRRELQRILSVSMRQAAVRRVPFMFKWADGTKNDLVVLHPSAHQDLLASVLQTLHQLEGRQFEHVCMELLGLYGFPADLCHLTPARADGGLDFYGILPALETSGLTRLRGQAWRVIGQATLASPSVAKVASFCHRVGQVRSESGRYWDLLEPFFKASPLPIIGLFVTLDLLGPTAQYDSRHSVVLFLDGQQVAADLAETPAFARWRNGDGSFSPTLFLADFPQN